ncbi:hypothetical protein G6F56_012276 [Rhizopus delemar]|nr:hypothetical protein G6F56_012276 [Rhizopus delemar]
MLLRLSCSWVRRTNESNRQQAIDWKNACSQDARDKLEKKFGTRHSALHNLPYFDVVRCTAVDPMHGLFLGTAKRMVHIWRTYTNKYTNTVYLPDTDIKNMQAEANQVVLPQQYTPVHQKIGSLFANMKSDEWRTWVLGLSPYLLKGRLPIEHKENWAMFVQACQILCAPSITLSDATHAHNLLKQFAIGVALHYGPEAVTPNMHLHLHLLEAIRDFGPIYSFWVYAFERLNGDIKKMTVNYKSSFEVTYMRKFLQTVHYNDYIRNLPENIKCNTLMMKMFECIAPTYIDPLADSGASTSLFDFNTFSCLQTQYSQEKAST